MSLRWLVELFNKKVIKMLRVRKRKRQTGNRVESVNGRVEMKRAYRQA